MPYQIVYWPGFTGRAEPAILLLEDAGETYEIVTDVHERISALAVDHPVFATPILVDGDTVVSQTSVIAEYLGRKHGYDVADSDRIAAAQLAYNVADIWEETYVSGKNNDTTYYQERFPRWLALLENSFAASSDMEFFFSNAQPTYVDFLVLNVVKLAAYCWGTPAAAQIDAQPQLGAWLQRMLARPRIEAYFNNPSALPVGREAVRAIA
jgi:glutathione S-transferase